MASSRIQPTAALWARAINSPILRLWALGLCSAAVYLFVFTLRFPLIAWYEKLTDVGYVTDYSVPAAALYLGGVAALFALYVVAWRQARILAVRQSLWPIYVLALLFGVITLFMYPVWAIDLYNYVVRGREWVVHGANPLVVPPSAFPDDPFTPLSGGWSDHATPYGPLWIVLSAPASLIFGDNLLGNLLYFKILALLSCLGCAALVSSILGKTRPELRAAGTLLFAWNPVLLLEVVGHGHNDAAMAFFTLAAIALSLSRWKMASLATFALSALTKYTSAVLFPVLFLKLIQSHSRWKDRLKLGAAASVLAVVPIVAVFAPFWAGRQTFEVIGSQNGIYINSFAWLLRYAGDQGLVPKVGEVFPQVLLPLAFLIFYIVQLRRLYVRPGSWAMVAFEVSFATIFVLSSFETWYLVWPLALAALIQPGLVAWRTILLTFTATLVVFLWGYLWVWHISEWDFNSINLITIPAVLLPPILLSLWQLGRGATARPGSD